MLRRLHLAAARSTTPPSPPSPSDIDMVSSVPKSPLFAAKSFLGRHTPSHAALTPPQSTGTSPDDESILSRSGPPSPSDPSTSATPRKRSNGEHSRLCQNPMGTCPHHNLPCIALCCNEGVLLCSQCEPQHATHRILRGGASNSGESLTPTQRIQARIDAAEMQLAVLAPRRDAILHKIDACAREAMATIESQRAGLQKQLEDLCTAMEQELICERDMLTSALHAADALTPAETKEAETIAKNVLTRSPVSQSEFLPSFHSTFVTSMRTDPSFALGTVGDLQAVAKELAKWDRYPHNKPDQPIQGTFISGTYLNAAVHLVKCAPTPAMESLGFWAVGRSLPPTSSIKMTVNGESREFTKRRLYVEAINKDESNAAAYLSLGAALSSDTTVTLSNGRVMNKRELFREAICCDPSCSAAYNNLATDLETNEKVALPTGEYSKVQLLVEAIHHNPNYPAALYNLASALHKDERISLRDGRVVGRRDLLIETIRQSPNYGAAYLMLALIIDRDERVQVYGIGNFSRTDLLLDAIRCRPESVDAYHHLGAHIHADELMRLHDGRVLSKQQLLSFSVEQ